MKNALLYILFLSTIACNSPAPKATKGNCELDGRTFKIENFVDGKLDGTEMLVFKAGKAENDECTKYGFGSGVYTCDENSGFKYSLISEKEGKMDWEGAVTGNAIAGKMVWIKAGQNDIHYTFKGEEVQ